MCPKSIEVTDTVGGKHSVDVEILGVEETWKTPSILLAVNRANNGRAIFSQVHLEADPSQFENDEGKYKVLKESNNDRLEILRDLLATHLNVEVQSDFQAATDIQYSPGYLLADDNNRKRRFLESIESQLNTNGCLSSGAINLKFLRDDQGESCAIVATQNFLPVNTIKTTPEFNDQEYFKVRRESIL